MQFSVIFVVFFICIVHAQYHNRRSKRNTVPQRKLPWKNALLKYYFASPNTFSEYEILLIRLAMQEIEERSCLKFKEVPKGSPWYATMINKTSETACGVMNKVRYQRYPTKMVKLLLSPTCADDYETIIHELLHMAGFLHEHQRHDARSHIALINPLKPDDDDNDQYKPSRYGDTIGPYDVGSVMHYGSDFIYLNGTPSDMHGEGFSMLDLYRLNKLYNCPYYTEAEPEPNIIEQFKYQNCLEYAWCAKWERSCSSDVRWSIGGRHLTKPETIAYMNKNCPKTCGLCELKEQEQNLPICKEEVAWCDKFQDFCFGDRQYYVGGVLLSLEETHKQMLEECAKTCGVCKVANTIMLTTTPQSTTTTTSRRCHESPRWCGQFSSYCTGERPFLVNEKLLSNADTRDYMVKNCPSTCDACPATSAPTTTAEATTTSNSITTRSSRCHESNRWCGQFSSFCTGERPFLVNEKLLSNAETRDYMVKNCPSTCDACPTTSAPTTTAEATSTSNSITTTSSRCHESNRWCGQFSSFCTGERPFLVNEKLLSNAETRDYMVKNCPSTCDACPTTSAPTTTAEATTTSNSITTRSSRCHESNRWCGQFSSFCTGERPFLVNEKLLSNAETRDYMVKNCPSTCDACPTTSAPTTTVEATTTSNSITTTSSRCHESNRWCGQFSSFCTGERPFLVNEKLLSNAETRDYMVKNCPSTCDACPTTSAPTTTAEATTTSNSITTSSVTVESQTPEPCFDDKPWCSEYVLACHGLTTLKSGSLKMSFNDSLEYMWQHCPKTCGFCPEDEDKCQDLPQHHECMSRRAGCVGEVGINGASKKETEVMMQKTCPATCGQCPGPKYCIDWLDSCQSMVGSCKGRTTLMDEDGQPMSASATKRRMQWLCPETCGICQII